jgi:hypothetical protein
LTILSAFFFSESRIQAEYGGNYLVQVNSSKLVSVVFQLLGVNGAYDLPFFLYNQA